MNSATSIKCKFSNGIHKMLEPNIGVKKSDRWRLPKKELTDAEKIELFDKISAWHKECSNELSACLYKRRERNRIRKQRIANGYVPKRKTTKADYEKSLHPVG